MKAFIYNEGSVDEDGQEIAIPAELQDEAEFYRDELINAVAEFDDELMMNYLDGEEVTAEIGRAHV